MGQLIRGKANKIIIGGIITAFAIGIAYGAITGASTSPDTSPTPSEPRNDAVIIHTHSALKIILEGKSVTVPANIGIDPALYKSHDLDAYGTKNPRMSPLHTHDSTGVIHVESTEIRSYTIGEFFDVWGVPFSETCFMDKCDDGTTVRMWVNAKESNEYRQHILMDGEVIEIIVT